MTQIQGWEEIFSTELQQAEDARQSGNEGRARVCARRAAGIAVAEFLSRTDHNFEDRGAYENLKYFITLPDISYELKETVTYFIIRVDENYQLPIDVDLIEEAQTIKKHLNVHR